MSEQIALRVSELRKRYGSHQALASSSFELRRGQRLAIVGPNGAGKTTLLSLIAGVQQSDGGSVSLAPHEVGWVPQRPAVYGKLTVAENLRLFARLEGVADVEPAVQRMLLGTDLLERAHERVERLSGGNRQRVNVAAGLLGGPAVIALDEPSTALDPAQRLRLWELVRGLCADGTAAIFSTHIVSEAARHADVVLVLDDGEQAFLGTPAQLRAAGSRQGARPREHHDGLPSGDGDGPPLHDGEGAFEDALIAFLARRRVAEPESGVPNSGDPDSTEPPTESGA